jgi:hypothetical protein
MARRDCSAAPHVLPANRNKIESRRADSRTAYPCSSYEFACVRTGPSYCVRKPRLFGQFSIIRRCHFVHCVPVSIGPVAVHRWPSTRVWNEASGVGQGITWLGVGQLHGVSRSLWSAGTFVMMSSRYSHLIPRRPQRRRKRTSGIGLLITMFLSGECKAPCRKDPCSVPRL